MTIRLRPHHLLCLLTYVGKGYTAPFVENYDRIAERLSSSEDILIVGGPDDICAPLLVESDPHCWGDGVDARDRAAAAHVGILLGTEILAGSRLTIDREMLALMREAFALGRTRQACSGCEWSALCTLVSRDDYRQSRVAVVG